MSYNGIKRKVFISFYKGDNVEVDSFIDYFANQENVFTPFVLGANDNDDFIDSSNTDYVMNKIRNDYLQDTTVTIVLIGSCTHSRRYVDWEIKSSLRQGINYIPNGLIGIILPNQGNSAYLPPRFESNWNKELNDCYARYYIYPNSPQQLGDWIDDAYKARSSRNQFIVNPQDMMRYNSKCKNCNITH
ncbi:MAG: hypothetical protein A2Y41_10415 [Spirochaetes bacterium GWB1_36_13]|nr:MAG: hypothetical protein A2Y41_10415 [Spirochaetes bacterium GWB1_36_13]